MISSAASSGVSRTVLRGVSVAIVWTTLLTSPGHAASLFDPALRFRTIPTEHFVIYFHQGAEPLARRLAALAEETWMALRRPLGVQPPPRTHVVLVDQSELADGSATPVPYNTVIVTTLAVLGEIISSSLVAFGFSISARDDSSRPVFFSLVVMVRM